MALIKTSYPATSSVALTIALASLASDSTLLAGRASTAVDNTTNNDIDHLLSGTITTGTSPTVGTTIELWLYASTKTTTGSPTYPYTITGSDAAFSFASFNTKRAGMVMLDSFTVDASSNQPYVLRQTSIASQFGGALPKFWGLFIVHNTGVALNATAGNHSFQYERHQNQTV